ncbi:MAG: isoprenylcysteine carboxylmethyltransferase family protein [Chloroflexi bacterium]|nr:isoprenylcysteine carboxylmethyltransferase family protein [Chloroflexota bacterium]
MSVGSVFAIVRIVGGVLAATLVGIWLGAPLAAWLDAQMPLRLPFDLRWLGWLVIVSAIGLITSAEVSFVRFGGGTGVPSDPPQQLVARGVYRWVRNPLYLSGNALVWGTALVHHSAGLLALALVIVIGFHLFVVLFEEPQLEKRYGDSYREYKKRVPRWLPRFPKSI